MNINNEEAALVYRYFLLLNNAESEMDRHSLLKELLLKMNISVERKNNFITLLRSQGIVDFKIC